MYFIFCNQSQNFFKITTLYIINTFVSLKDNIKVYTIGAGTNQSITQIPGRGFVRNEIDEEFRFVQKQLKDTVVELLRVYLKGKMPMKTDAAINRILKKRLFGDVEEEEWVDIIKYMCIRLFT